MTVRDLLTRSSRSIGRLGRDETLSAAEAADALVVLSDVLDGWQTERLTIFSEGRTVNALVSNVQRYTLGPSGDWDQARPLWIDRVTRQTADGYETPIVNFTRTRWSRLTPKAMTSTLPDGIYVNLTFPQAEVDVWPVPTDNTVKIVLYAPSAPLTSASSLDTVLSLPPGWSPALRYDLALALGIEYAIEPSELLVSRAVSTKAAIKRTNQLSDEVELDPFLTRGRRSMSRATFESGNF